MVHWKHSVPEVMSVVWECPLYLESVFFSRNAIVSSETLWHWSLSWIELVHSNTSNTGPSMMDDVGWKFWPSWSNIFLPQLNLQTDLTYSIAFNDVGWRWTKMLVTVFGCLEKLCVILLHAYLKKKWFYVCRSSFSYVILVGPTALYISYY